ncbi:hypothetical protein LTR37_017278 [Vermiconidia calcicola]|uniref:Uncharacterized protein n=1 Tax=Vermiconidia calcicola TaxID=1690605 RepID=A0ACC3ML90_9PEZI|nr:hypothetical protein LTR37_017278 [Vermiconidia calcicola]
MAPIPLSIATRTTLLLRDEGGTINATPTIDVTALCIEKAAWVAHQSAKASTDIRIAMAVLVLQAMAKHSGGYLSVS